MKRKQRKNFFIYSAKRVLLLIIIFIIVINTTRVYASRNKTDWFHDAKWGVMTTFLTSANTSVKDWNGRVDNFNVKRLANQLQSIGAGYYMITIGQNSGHYCAPNTEYNRLTQISPSKCSSRDLISDLYNALNPVGIKLMVYLPSGAPYQDSIAVKKLEWTNGEGQRNKSFQVKWESIITEWSLRWGKKVQGWWFDGVYWPKEMYEDKEAPNFKSFAAAAKAGNSKSIIAFNSGINYPVSSLSSYEDYTAGEINEPLGMECEGRWIKNAQFHVLSYLGSNWGIGANRYTNRQVIDITRNVNRCGGVMTWDVPIQSNGSIAQPFISQLISLKNGIRNKSLSRKAILISNGNVAFNKKSVLLDITGKVSLPVNGTKHFPSLGVDGDPKTFARAGNEWPWIYQINLDNNYLINKIVVTFGPYFATNYKVLSSNDGVKWNTLKHEINSLGGKQVHDFRPTSMRYIRILGIKPDNENQVGVQMSIAEVEAYQ
jgi:F5/8 type C domain